MNFSDLVIDLEIGINYSGTLGALDKEESKFISSSRSTAMLVIYLVLMAYLIGGLNILKLKFLFPCLEDLCSIYGDVRLLHVAPTVLLEIDYLSVFHVGRPVLLRDILDVH